MKTKKNSRQHLFDSFLEPTNMAETMDEKIKNYRTAPFDARFPNTNQTRNCFQNYLDFHRCNKALSAKGQDVSPCQWYQRVYKSLCPMGWALGLTRGGAAFVVAAPVGGEQGHQQPDRDLHSPGRVLFCRSTPALFKCAVRVYVRRSTYPSDSASAAFPQTSPHGRVFLWQFSKKSLLVRQ
ncbi:hypothetical protein CCH79_00010893 [Gambusia affinis]|uniref:Cytochrome c oxidase subunit 6B1 n=1 Tax=Gambusia affinis TaxID=33528 RepID=A0A315VJT8_GAMAF|nr:hypothetical protein CCH79_00010893 [Gambusia affinis]